MLRRSLASAAAAAPRAARSLASMPAKPTVAIAGVTGAVGQEILKILEERNFPLGGVKMLASARSAGKTVEFAGKSYTVEELREDSFKGVDIALFSAGGGRSKEFAPAAVRDGCVVVDNSSAFRMTPDVPLVVPEVNPEATFTHKGIIANPNCSTIIMNLVVWPLHRAAGVKRVVCSTYQAASGAGAAAMEELERQAADWAQGKPLNMDIFGRQYLWNLFSHNSPLTDTLYNEEEMKMVNETRKIFGAPDMPVTATCVRVPVLRAHCESINLQLERPMGVEEAREVLANAPGVRVLDDVAGEKFPEPLIVSGRDDVDVGRVRNDISLPNNTGIDLFVAGDQLRKGAALNAVQIAELLVRGQ